MGTRKTIAGRGGKPIGLALRCAPIAMMAAAGCAAPLPSASPVAASPPIAVTQTLLPAPPSVVFPRLIAAFAASQDLSPEQLAPVVAGLVSSHDPDGATQGTATSYNCVSNADDIPARFLSIVCSERGFARLFAYSKPVLTQSPARQSRTEIGARRYVLSDFLKAASASAPVIEVDVEKGGHLPYWDRKRLIAATAPPRLLVAALEPAMPDSLSSAEIWSITILTRE